jgi:hypothetical protein
METSDFAKIPVQDAHLPIQNNEGKRLIELLGLEQELNLNEIISSYCKELQWLLSAKGLIDFIERLFALEDLLFLVKEEQQHLNENHIPSLEQIYSQMSPRFLRLLLKQDETPDQCQLIERLYGNLKELVDEEIFLWREKL